MCSQQDNLGPMSNSMPTLCQGSRLSSQKSAPFPPKRNKNPDDYHFHTSPRTRFATSRVQVQCMLWYLVYALMQSCIHFWLVTNFACLLWCRKWYDSARIFNIIKSSPSPTYSFETRWRWWLIDLFVVYVVVVIIIKKKKKRLFFFYEEIRTNRGR